MRRTFSLLAALALVGAALLSLGGTAGAAVTVSVTPNAGLHDSDTVTVSWTGMTPNGTPSIAQCVANPATGATGPDCEFQTLVLADDNSNGAGAGTSQFTVHDTNALVGLNSNTLVRCDVDHPGSIIVLDNPNDLSSGTYKGITCVGSSSIVHPPNVLLSCTGLDQIMATSPPLASNSARYVHGAAKKSIGDRSYFGGDPIPADTTQCDVGTGIRNHNPATDYVSKPGAKPVVNPFDNSAHNYQTLTTTGALGKVTMVLAGSATCQTVPQPAVDGGFPSAYPLQGKLIVKFDQTYPNASNVPVNIQMQAFVQLGKDATDPDPSHWTVTGTVILGPGVGGTVSGTVRIGSTIAPDPLSTLGKSLLKKNLNPGACTDTDVTDDSTDASIGETAVTLADGSDPGTAVDPLVVTVP